MIDRLNDLTDKISDLKGQDKSIKSFCNSLNKTCIELGKECDYLKDSIELARMSIEFVSQIMKELSKAGREQAMRVVNQGLEFIFFDMNYEFVLEMSEQGKKCDMMIIDHNDNKKDLLSECGGGLIVTVSFLLNVFFILYFKLRPVLLLDESMTQVSSLYIERLFEFIRTLVDHFSFDFLVVTHDIRIKEFAKTTYQVSNNGIVRKLK